MLDIPHVVKHSQTHLQAKSIGYIDGKCMLQILIFLWPASPIA